MISTKNRAYLRSLSNTLEALYTTLLEHLIY